MKSKEKILVFSDIHFSENTRIEEARWHPPAERILPKRIAVSYLRKIDNLTQEYFYKMLNQASRLKPFDCIIGLGDGTPGTNQRGLITEKAKEERLRYQEKISEFFPETEKRFLWGNHDTGFYDRYTSILSLGSQKGYMSKESFRIAEELIGPPWESFELGNFVFLLLNSEIIRASREKESVSPDKAFFEEQEKKQEKFIEDVLSNGSNQIVLVIHNPKQLKFLLSILEKYQDRICLTLAGHYHTWSSEKVCREFPWGEKINFTEIIPNTWGVITRILSNPWRRVLDRFLGGKGGFAVLELSGCSFEPPKYYWL